MPAHVLDRVQAALHHGFLQSIRPFFSFLPDYTVYCRRYNRTYEVDVDNQVYVSLVAGARVVDEDVNVSLLAYEPFEADCNVQPGGSIKIVKSAYVNIILKAVIVEVFINILV